MHHFIESLTGNTFEYKIDHSKLIVSLCMGYSIRMNWDIYFLLEILNMAYLAYMIANPD